MKLHRKMLMLKFSELIIFSPSKYYNWFLTLSKHNYVTAQCRKIIPTWNFHTICYQLQHRAFIKLINFFILHVFGIIIVLSVLEAIKKCFASKTRTTRTKQFQYIAQNVRKIRIIHAIIIRFYVIFGQ